MELVERILSLHKRLVEAKAPHDKTVIQQQIAVTDKQIDKMAYELYDLTDEEIKMVEETTITKGIAEPTIEIIPATTYN